MLKELKNKYLTCYLLFILLLLGTKFSHLTVMNTISKVDRQANRHPDNQSEPGIQWKRIHLNHTD